METISTAKSFGGTQGVYRHKSATNQCDMTFAVFCRRRPRMDRCRSYGICLVSPARIRM